jgi:hypothetical protein
MKPSVGRIVHYVSPRNPSGECRAAIVTDADGSDTVGLCVFNQTVGVFGQSFERAVANDEEWRAAGTWHWPERSES